MAETTRFNYAVVMPCEGCSKSLTKILGDMKKANEEFEDFTIDQKIDRITVTLKSGSEKFENVIHERLQDSGKETARADKDWNKLPVEVDDKGNKTYPPPQGY